MKGDRGTDGSYKLGITPQPHPGKQGSEKQGEAVSLQCLLSEVDFPQQGYTAWCHDLSNQQQHYLETSIHRPELGRGGLFIQTTKSSNKIHTRLKYHWRKEYKNIKQTHTHAHVMQNKQSPLLLSSPVIVAG